MDIKLSINQGDIEQAIRDYVIAKGITTPVRAISFSVSRRGGTAVSAEVEVSEAPTEVVQAEPEAPEPKPAASKVKSKPASEAVKKEEVVDEPVTATDSAPEEATDSGEDDTPPFDTGKEAANDAQTAPRPKAAASSGKSLFG